MGGTVVKAVERFIFEISLSVYLLSYTPYIYAHTYTFTYSNYGNQTPEMM